MKPKVLIVDDEPLICKGLRLTIPWEELGAEVIGEAYNGVQALKLMKENPADLVLTDVKMPHMNGLEFVRRLHQEGCCAKVVMLSGYEEFAYVQSAMQYGVKNYLLKPVDAEELTVLIAEQLLEIALAASERSARKLEAYYHYIAAELMEHAEPKAVPIPDPNIPCYLTVSRIAEYYRLTEQIDEQVQQIVRSDWKMWMARRLLQAGVQSVSVFLRPNALLTVAFAEESGTEQLLSMLESGSGEMEEHGGCRLEWTALAEPQPFIALKDTVPVLIRMLDGGSMGLATLAGGEESASGTVPAAIDYPKETEKELLDLLFQFKEEQMREAVNSLFERFRSERTGLREALHVCQEIFIMIKRRIREAVGKEYACRLPKLKDADIEIYNSLEAIGHLFLEALMATIHLLRTANFGKNHWIVDRVTSYIRANYALDLRACDIAEMIRITPNYFSSIFKQETGRSFHEYVNEIRIDKAKELLASTSELVGTIALAVGYKDYKHFAGLFKKQCGVIPTEYRDMHRSKSV